MNSKFTFLHNKTFLIVVLIAIILAIFLGFQYSKKPEQTKKDASIKKPATAQTTLVLKPNPLFTTSASQSAVNIQINTKKNKVTAVQLELSYDPLLLKNVSIVPGPFLRENIELIKTIDESQGRISYALGIPPGSLVF